MRNTPFSIFFSIAVLLISLAVMISKEQPGPGSGRRVIIDDFESYPSQEAFVKQWYNVWHGGKMTQSLEPEIKQSGKYSMKCAYSTTKSTDKFYSPICRVSKWDLSGTNAVQFWLKPDGSGRELTFQLNIANSQGKNIHDLWEYAYRPVKGDTSARIVTIPYAQLVHNTKYKDAPDVSPVFKPEAVIEVALYIGGSQDEPGDGAYYFDDFVAVSVK